MCHAIALADIVSYIEDCKYGQSVAQVFLMPEIVNMHSDRLKQLGIYDCSTIHSTKLKDKILANVTDLQAHEEGRVNLLAQLLRRLVRMMTLILTLSRFIKQQSLLETIFCTVMSTQFSGSFPSECQETAIPQSLFKLVNMLLCGTELTSDTYSEPALSLSQLIMFNCIKRSKNTRSLYHSYSREPPLPV